jgi:hypothetical protein
LKLEWGIEKGSNLGFESFQNYSTFYTKTLKTPKTKIVQHDQIYNFAFGPTPNSF